MFLLQCCEDVAFLLVVFGVVLVLVFYNTNALLDSSYRLFSSSYCTKRNARVKRKMNIVASDVW